MVGFKKYWPAILLCLALCAITLAAYWPVFRNDFIKLDDHQYVLENPHVLGGLTRADIKWAFQSGYASNWHPLTWLSHMTDVQLFGVKPAWHHSMNLLLHIANTLLLWLLLRRITGAFWRSAFVAALFAVHPLHVESVAWVAERKDVLSTLFFLLTIWAYAEYVAALTSGARSSMPSTGRHQPSLAPRSTLTPGPTLHARAYYSLSLLLFALGLMSKPMLVTLPFVLFLLDWWPLNRIPIRNSSLAIWKGNPALRRLFLEKIPFFFLAAASSLITFTAQAKGHSVSMGLPLEARLDNAVASYLKYLGKAFFPVDLAIFYPHPELRYPISTQWSDWQLALAVLVLAATSLVALIRVRRQPWFATGWFWFLGTLVPVIGIVQVGAQAMADRYTYIPLIGIFVCCVWAAADFLSARPWGRPVLGLVGVSLLGICVALTNRQVRYWHDTYTLCEHALAVTTDNSVADYEVGVEMGERGKYEQALAYLRAAVAADSGNADALCALGFTFQKLGKPDAAIEQYRAAIQVRPWHALAHSGLGLMLWLRGDRREALSQYQEAVRLNPENADIQYNYGTAMADEGRFAEAARCFAEAVRVCPDDIEARTRLAEMLVRQNKLGDAEFETRELVRLYPTNAAAHIHLGDILRLVQKPAEAAEQYAEALQLKPDDSQAQFNLGSILLQQGKLNLAAERFAQAARLKPDFAQALAGWGRALAAQNRLSEAQERFGDALRLCPTNVDVQLDLGNCLVLQGKTNEAAGCFSRALGLEPDLPEKTLKAAKLLLDEGQFEAALGRLTTALALKPESAEAREDLGLLWAKQGKLENAVKEFQQSLRLYPTAERYYHLALALVMQGKAKEAIANYKQALKLRPDWTAPLNDLAWLLATCPQPDMRNGAEAVRLAEHACQLSQGGEARFWGTLDAAYAEAGRFSDALSAVQKAQQLALAAGQKDLAQAAEMRAALYRKQQPFHQPEGAMP